VCSKKEHWKRRTPQATLEKSHGNAVFPKRLHFVNHWMSFVYYYALVLFSSDSCFLAVTGLQHFCWDFQKHYIDTGKKKMDVQYKRDTW